MLKEYHAEKTLEVTLDILELDVLNPTEWIVYYYRVPESQKHTFTVVMICMNH